MEVYLKFPSFVQLWEFKKGLGHSIVSIYPESNTLYCYCTQEDVKLAIDEFEAVLIEGFHNNLS
jgi:hypothetical protein